MPDFVTLIRLPLCGAVAGSALVGYLAAGGGHGWRAAGLVAGVLLAAGGASILNQWQERHSDALMTRTCRRPLACGRLAAATGVALGAGMAGAGTLLLFGLDLIGGLLTTAILLLYLAVYTPLKRHTMLAMVPGALCGALPPAIGWLVAGGSLQAPRLSVMTALLLLWQIPHSWQILLVRRRDLQRAGLFPELHRLPPRRLQQLLLTWTAALSCATLAVAALPGSAPAPLRWLCAVLAFWPLVFMSRLRSALESDDTERYGWRRASGIGFLGMLLGVFLLHF